MLKMDNRKSATENRIFNTNSLSKRKFLHRQAVDL